MQFIGRDSLRRRLTSLATIISLIVLVALLTAFGGSAAPAHGQGGPANQAGQGNGPDLSLYPLLFQRAGASSYATPEATASADTNPDGVAQVLMVGDTSFARGIEDVTNKNGIDYPLNQVSPWLQAADLAVGNYEGVIAADGIGTMRTMGYRLRSQPAAATAVAKAGFKLVNVANNHTVDWGPASLKATLDNLHAAGVATVGAGPNAEAAQAPKVIRVKGIKLVFISFTMVPDPPDSDRDTDTGWTRSFYWPPWDKDKLTAQIKAALPLGDAVIVQFHWGNEYVPCPKDWEIELARAGIRAGAALIIGHHPHIVQSFEKYQNGFIAYSLGNFLFDQPRTPGLGLWIRFDKKGVIDVHGLPLHPGEHPEWFPPDKAAAQLRGLCPLDQPRAKPTTTSFSFSEGHYTENSDSSVDASVLPGSADQCSEHKLTTRTIGQIDMKGDGGTERVTLSAGTLHIYEGDQEVYTSHPSWQVVDASLGDPNQDGRYEVTMLLWKQDKPGDPVTTHPFILGYRGGRYQVIWGGSDTASWLQALGVADVDGDSLDELVTIERDPGALPCDPVSRVVVLKWNGWGFTKQWASDYGLFNELGFQRSAGDEGGRAALPVTIVAR